MVRSLLGDLIARTKEEATTHAPSPPREPSPPPTASSQRANNHPANKKTSQPERTSLRKNKYSRKDKDGNDRKQAAKRKRQVNFQKQKNDENGDDDDSLYNPSDNDVDTAEENQAQNDSDDDETKHDAPHQEDYSKAFSAIYGPPTGPAGASVSADYLLTLQEVMVPNDIVPPVLRYSTPEERKQPRFLRKRNRKTKTWETIQETDEQAEDRFHRQERVHERQRIEDRWKHRSFDLRQEEDVGGAFYQRAKRHLKEKIQKEMQENSRKQKAEAEQKALEIANARRAQQEDEDSVQEQQDVLDRLTQNSMDATMTTRTTKGEYRSSQSGGYTSGDETEDIWTVGDAPVSYRDRMGYWEYGWSAPQSKDLEFRYNAPDVTPQLKCGEELRDPDGEDRGLRLPRRNVASMNTGSGKKKHDWEPSYFPHSKTPRQPRFFHYRMIQALAARHLCGGSLGEDPGREDRFLRLLFSPVLHEPSTLAQFSYARALLRLSHQMGCNALLYAQNIWSNPLEAARELFLLPQEATPEPHPLAGHTLNPEQLKLFMQRRRLAVLKKLRIKSRPWSHAHKALTAKEISRTEKGAAKAMDVDRATGKERVNDSTKSGLEGLKDEGDSTYEDSSQNPFVTGIKEIQGVGPAGGADAIGGIHVHQEKGNLESVEGGTSAGVVLVDQNTQGSQSEFNATINEASPHGPAANGEAFLVPSTTFSHVPGTSPPVPPFPLDALSTVYGPADRHAKYHHQDNMVHHYHFHLALSTLLSRALMTKGSHGIDELQRRIQIMLEQYVEITDNKGYRRQFLYSRGKVRDVPSVQLYLAIQSYCSFYANGFPRRGGTNSLATKEEDAEETEDTNDGPREDLYIRDERDPLSLRDVAKHMYVFLDHNIQHNGLARFSRLRVIYALAFVAHKIPNGAAEILAKPIDDHESPTPLHILRRTCLYLESSNLIRGGKDSGYTVIGEDEAMRDGELEYIFFEAAGKLEAAVKVAPTDIYCHLWRIGMLSACLLLSSGNRIGSGARKYPSRATRRTYETVGSDPDALEHETRERLPKYEEIAALLSSAVNVLFSLARHQPGECVHRAVASFLEWRQVVALLAGKTLEQSIDGIVALHSYHAFQRYLCDDSESARKAATASSNSITFYASELERDPGDIKRWRNLVDAVGPIGVMSMDANSEQDAHANTCLHCQFTRHPRTFDHQRREAAGPTWWGRNREWWLSSILKSHSTSSRNGPIVGEVVRNLEACDQAMFVDAVEPMQCCPVKPDAGSYSQWLPTRERLREQRYTKPSREECMVSFDHELPASACDRNGLATFDDERKQRLSSLLRVQVPKVEVMCYKIFLCCQLVGPGDRIVEKALLELLLRGRVTSESMRQRSDEWQALEWLYCAGGLDIPKLTKYYYGESLNKAVKKVGDTSAQSKKLKA